jgi:hypothetical protein
MNYMILSIAVAVQPVGALPLNHSTQPPAVVYEATGGTISPSGRYAAGAVPGLFKVAVSLSGTTLRDEATAIITGNAPHNNPLSWQNAALLCTVLPCFHLIEAAYFDTIRATRRRIGFHVRGVSVLDLNSLITIALGVLLAGTYLARGPAVLLPRAA